MHRFALLFIALFAFAFQTSHAEQTLEEHLQEILLVIHYNHPHYESIPFLRKVYSIFPNIVFYGEGDHPDVTAIETQNGYFFAKVAIHAMQHYPGFKGYLFVQDDCALNFWNLGKFDKDKIWFGANESNQFYHYSLETPPTVNSLINPQLPCLNPTLLWGIHDALPEDERNLLENNLKPLHFALRACDIFYIPERLTGKALQILPLFTEIFCEVAVPTALCCIEDLSNWECLKFKFMTIPIDPRLYYSPNFDAVHPIKFSSVKEQKFFYAVACKNYPPLILR